MRHALRLLFFIALLACIWTFLSQKPRSENSGTTPANANAILGLVASSSPSTATPFTFGSQRSVDNISIVEPILSLIRNYYVDKDRVDFVGLSKILVLGLKDHKELKVTERGDEVTIANKNHVLKVKLDEMNTFIKVVELIENITEISSNDKDPSAVLEHMLNSLDAHSSILERDAYRELKQGTEGAFGGLGVLVGIQNNLLTVIKPLPRSPAEKVGIQRFDKILSIDGKPTFGKTLDTLVEFMRGDPGKAVSVSLLREGEAAPLEYTINREIIQVDSVMGEEVIISPGEKALLVKIESFSSRTSRELFEVLRSFRKGLKKEFSGLILDLRSNPGGLLDQAVQVSDMFLQSGVIVTTQGRRIEVEAAGQGYDEMDYPMVVLIDEDSASASEIVAGALQDHGRAIVLGQPSFGKGSVQTIFELPSERALKLTIARYYTPNGSSIQSEGIVPDVWLQPVVKKNVNLNLLGNYRYRNEMFLRNHLQRKKEDKFHRLHGTSHFKSYYLVPDHKRNYFSKVKEDDVDLELAKKIIKKIRTVYPNRIPPEANRASHWLALSSKEVVSFGKVMESSTLSWLSKGPKVNWTYTSGFKKGMIKLHFKDRKFEVKVGKKLNIPFTLKNIGDQDIHRVSVFLSSAETAVDTTEKLVGLVEKKSLYNGTIQIHFPREADVGDYVLNAGIAVEAYPYEVLTEKLHIKLVDSVTPVLTVAQELIDESGEKDGILEPGEEAKIKILISNFSGVDTKEFKLAPVNLSGRQVSFDFKERLFPVLKFGETREVLVPIKVSDYLVSEKVRVGLSMVGTYVYQHEEFVMPAIPLKKKKISNRLAR